MGKQNKRFINNLLDKLAMYAIIGASADQQTISGENKKIYEDLLSRNDDVGLERILTPFFGYDTKSLAKVLAENSIPINTKFLGAEYLEFKESISGKKSEEFYSWRDDEKQHEIRVNITTKFLNERFVKIGEKLGYKFDELLTRKGLENSENQTNRIAQLTQSQLSKKGLKVLKYIAKTNIKKFGDPDRVKEYLQRINEPQHIIRMPNNPLINGKTLKETANQLTAISKLRGRHYYLEALNGNQKATEMITQLKKTYNEGVWESMRYVEEQLLFNKKDVTEIDSQIQYMRMDGLKNIFNKVIQKNGLPNDISLSLPTIVGVIGGIAVNNKLIPNDYGLFLTAAPTTTYNSVNQREQKSLKISARISDHPKFKHIHLGELMNKYFGGGGHRTAAACTIPLSEENTFLLTVKEYFRL